MGWSARRGRKGPTRFDSWQNRPDRGGGHSRPWPRARLRALAIWLAVFVVLILGYLYAGVGWQALTRLTSGQAS